MRIYDTRAFYIPDPAPDRRSVSTASADEEDFEETSHTAESDKVESLARGWERVMILSGLFEGVVQQGQGLKLLAWVELLGGGQLRMI